MAVGTKERIKYLLSAEIEDSKKIWKRLGLFSNFTLRYQN